MEVILQLFGIAFLFLALVVLVMAVIALVLMGYETFIK